MKLKLVMIGKIDRKIIAYFNKEGTPFKDKLDEICERNIPDLKNWGPAESYYQLPDRAHPIGKHNRGKRGITVCFSQLLDKKGRKVKSLTKETLALVLSTLQEEFGIVAITDLQVFSETHASNKAGKSFFVEFPAVWL